MSYCTQSDLLEQISESKLIQLTDDADIGSIDADVITRAIADADAEIDGYAAVRYDVPFSPVPVSIRKRSVDITIYNLYARRSGAPEDRRIRYNDAIRFLKDLSKGIVAIGSDGPVIDSDGGPEATPPKSDRIFTQGRSSDSSTGSMDNY